MRSCLSHILTVRYPLLYRPRTEGPPSSFGLFGFEPDDGWFGLIDALSQVLNARANDRSLVITIAQVKEKLGTLRYYATGIDNFCFGACGFTEVLSRRVSELSGRPGLPLRIGYCLRTLAPGEDPGAELQSTRLPVERWIASCGPANALANVRAAWPSTHIAVPAGYADLVDELLLFLARSPAGNFPVSAVIWQADTRGDRFAIDMADLDDHAFGAIAVATRLAADWIDPATGGTGPADDLGRPRWQRQREIRGAMAALVPSEEAQRRSDAAALSRAIGRGRLHGPAKVTGR